MPYLNFRLRALAAVGLLLTAAPGLRAQDAPSAAPPLRGDVDGDGRVTPADAAAVRAWLVRGTLPGGRAILPAGDANGDGRVTAADAALISRFAAGVDVSRFPVGQPVPAGAGRLTTAFTCTMDVEAGATSCQLTSPTEGVDGARLNVVLGSPSVSLAYSGTTSSRGVAADEDTTTTSITLTNNIAQPLGTTDGTTAHPSGTRLFVSSGPRVTAVNSGTIAGSTIRVDNPEGTETYTWVEGSRTYVDKPYFQYDGVIAPNTAHPTRETVRFAFSSNVKTFTFSLLVSAPVQYEHGWITLAPATTPDLNPGTQVTFTGTVYNQVGQAQADGITWSSSNPSVATVDAGTGVVTAVAVGTATITATSTANAQRTGSREITVTNVNTWEGDVSSAWSTAGNWSAGVVPDSLTVADIPAAGSSPNMPVLTADASALDVSVGAGSTLGLGGFTLQVYGEVTSTGTISGGTLQFSGSSAGVQGNVGSLQVAGAMVLDGPTKATGPISVTGSLYVADQALSISVP